jgi:hypothetical protein
MVRGEGEAREEGEGETEGQSEAEGEAVEEGVGVQGGECVPSPPEKMALVVGVGDHPVALCVGEGVSAWGRVTGRAGA